MEYLRMFFTTVQVDVHRHVMRPFNLFSPPKEFLNVFIFNFLSDVAVTTPSVVTQLLFVVHYTCRSRSRSRRARACSSVSVQ